MRLRTWTCRPRYRASCSPGDPGKDQALQQAVSAWDQFDLSADEFLEQGDTVVVLGHTHVKKGEHSAEVPVVHVWRWEGDQLKRLQILTDTLQSAQLLGQA